MNENGEPFSLVLNSATLGLKSKTSVDLTLDIKGISFENLSVVYEFTLNKSPLFAAGTLYESKIISNLFDGMAEFFFLSILE